ncbi:hypothetical protein CSA37_01900 [Candidatus Fermentibacteria bacterium]|nr:MAG: hypothetical protein CSA37_01900 [Candidatus Fermentibacteria bacterium]
MKKPAAVLILLLFTVNTALASPVGQGGGSTPNEEESNLSTVIMIAVVAGFSALIIGDIITDNAEDSQDAISGVETNDASEDTGVDWGSLAADTADTSLPILSVSVFTVNDGRNLASYFSTLLEQGNGLYYNVHGNPAALGAMAPEEAAATGFAFLDCDWFIAGDSSGIYLFSRNSDEPLWQWNLAPADSASVRNAAAEFREFSSE